jgi:hypothetical protein
MHCFDCFMGTGAAALKVSVEIQEKECMTLLVQGRWCVLLKITDTGYGIQYTTPGSMI